MTLLKSLHPANLKDAGWENEPGDFEKIQIKLEKGGIVEFGYYDSWIKIEDPIKLPEQSQRVKQTPYFFTLDMGEGKYIMVLAGYAYASMPGYLTLIAVGQDTAEVIFNKQVDLLEIAETDQGYRLVGRLGVTGYGDNPCELLIEEGKLTFQPLSFKQVYESQDPPVVVYDCVGWGANNQPGDFTRLQIRTTEGELQELDNYGVWGKVNEHIKLPVNSPKIKRHPYWGCRILKNSTKL
ncbi:MAG: hypothetical protein MI674_02850 [Cytophagales bacterium]|nr:hypothetical protein [Cytophagales bacterium]